MRIPRHILLGTLIITAASLSVVTQAQPRERTASIYFYQGQSTFDPDYAGNGARLQSLRGRLVEKVVVSAEASPEGPAAVNERLAWERARSVADYVMEHLGADPEALAVEVKEDPWEHLETLVSASDWDQKDSALVLIRHHHDDSALAQADRRIRNYLYVCFYPELRTATIVYRDPEEEETSVQEEAPAAGEKTVISAGDMVPSADPASVREEVPVAEERISGGHWYLKTNFATWPLLVPNLAAEFEMGSHLSLSVPVYYSAWDWFSQERKFRVFGTQPELRWWFRRGTFLGPFAALHATFGWYNVALGGDYRYQDHRRGSPTFGGGVDLGWKVPLSRRWGLEFALGGGYLPLYTDLFYNVPDGRFVETRYRNYWGVDHAALTLTYQFDY